MANLAFMSVPLEEVKGLDNQGGVWDKRKGPLRVERAFDVLRPSRLRARSPANRRNHTPHSRTRTEAVHSDEECTATTKRDCEIEHIRNVGMLPRYVKRRA